MAVNADEDQWVLKEVWEWGPGTEKFRKGLHEF